MLGSIAPPWAYGQMKGDEESSTNGPAGLAPVAREMHMAVLGPWLVVTQPYEAGRATHVMGWVAGVA